MTTDQGGVIADDENSLKIGQRGPVRLENSALVEKLNHFNHTGVIAIENGTQAFLTQANRDRVWDREPMVRTVF